MERNGKVLTTALLGLLFGSSIFGNTTAYADTIDEYVMSQSCISYINNNEYLGKVVLDLPHHDTELDNGTSYGNYNEREISENISLKVKSILEANGIEVELMRERNGVISINDRVIRANSLGHYDYYISLHVNSCIQNNTGTGVEGWSNQGWSLTNKILNELTDEFDYENRGIKPTEFYNYFIHNKSTLIEMGFLNNDYDREKLVNQQDAYARRIAKAIIEQMKEDHIN